MAKKNYKKAFSKTISLRTKKGVQVQTIGEALNTGKAHIDAGNFAGGLDIASQILAQYPDNSGALFLIASYHLLNNDLLQAETIINQALDIDPDDTNSLYLHAKISIQASKPSLALKSLKKALKLEPKAAHLYIGLGEVFIKMGQEDKAIQALDRSIKIEKKRHEAYILKSYISNYTFSETELGNIEKILAIDAEQSGLYFALASHYEKTGDIAAQMNALDKGNRVVDRQLGPQAGWYKEVDIQAIKASFSQDNVEQLADKSDGGSNLIFIVGFPRSGSTLAEQIVSAHPDVTASGESDSLRLALGEYRQRTGGKITPPYSTRKYSAQEISDIRQIFYQQAATLAPQGRITDKSLKNFYYIGLIKLLFPKAKIIHTYKNAVDTCLGCYKQKFAGNVWPYIYDMQKLRKAYEEYHALMCYWESLFPGAVYHLSYESLISNQEKTTRQLLDYCGLSWNQACIDFHESDRVVTTASVGQIRKKLYGDAIGRWKKYENHIQPLLSLNTLSAF